MHLRRIAGFPITLLLLVIWALPAEASTITWEFTIHISYAVQRDYERLLGTDVFGTWTVDPETMGFEHYSVDRFGRVSHYFNYDLGLLTMDLPAVDEVWTFDRTFYQVRASDDWACTQLSYTCSLWGVSRPPFPGLEVRGFRQPSTDFRSFSTGNPASLWGGSACTICGTVTEIHATPEPASVALLGAGLLTIGVRLRRSRRRDMAAADQ